MRSYGCMRDGGINGHAPTALRMRSLARDSAETRESRAASGSVTPGLLSSRTATRSARRASFVVICNSAAAVAPTGPPPTMRTSNGSLAVAGTAPALIVAHSSSAVSPSRYIGRARAAHCRGKPRQARRGAAEAQTDPRQRPLRGRREIERQQAEVAQESGAGHAAAEEAHETVREAHHATAVGRTPVRELLQQLRRAYIAGRAGDHFREQRGITQTQIESLSGDRMQRLRGI